jgi:hypothetical protein
MSSKIAVSAVNDQIPACCFVAAKLSARVPWPRLGVAMLTPSREHGTPNLEPENEAVTRHYAAQRKFRG